MLKTKFFIIVATTFLTVCADAAPLRLAITGLPGAGKSTQIDLLVKKYPNIKVLYLGQVLRDHVTNKEKYTDIILKHTIQNKSHLM